MNNKTLHIRFQTLDDFIDQGKQALTSEGAYIQPEDEIKFSSVSEFEKFMTSKKIHLLSAIRSRSPESIYSLAKIVDRDVGNVSKDCNSLEAHGFIVFDDVGDNRESKKPILSFDYTEIRVHMPSQAEYSHTIAA